MPLLALAIAHAADLPLTGSVALAGAGGADPLLVVSLLAVVGLGWLGLRGDEARRGARRSVGAVGARSPAGRPPVS